MQIKINADIRPRLTGYDRTVLTFLIPLSLYFALLPDSPRRVMSASASPTNLLDTTIPFSFMSDMDYY